jgi:hypothetical protein
MLDNSHELFDFVVSATNELAQEYSRIQKKVREDPGTAGDEGEENWAELFRKWLPSTYHVRTKGRILSETGQSGPQIDVVILHPTYPPHLLSKKQFLAAGVAAAFECKLTLRAGHVEAAVANAAAIRRLLVRRRGGTPHRDLQSPLLYGLLAHSHDWTGNDPPPAARIEGQLCDADQRRAVHPSECVDLVCVADLATYVQHKNCYWEPPPERPDLQPCIRTGFCPHVPEHAALIRSLQGIQALKNPFLPIGSFLCSLFRLLAWEDPGLRPLAEYFFFTGMAAGGGVRCRSWPLSTSSEETRQGIARELAANCIGSA